jgi:hypothetical protein
MNPILKLTTLKWTNDRSALNHLSKSFIMWIVGIEITWPKMWLQYWKEVEIVPRQLYPTTSNETGNLYLKLYYKY